MRQGPGPAAPPVGVPAAGVFIGGAGAVPGGCSGAVTGVPRSSPPSPRRRRCPPVPLPQSAAAGIAAACSSSASSTRGGDIGSRVMRMPIASATAFVIAPIGGTMGVSPTPRTP